MSSLLVGIEAKDDQCWQWPLAPNSEGYGCIRYKGKKMRAHRFIYTLFIGDIPPGACIMHTCDNRLCVNPKHLKLGTWEDNNRDRRDKGRSALGERSGRAKLSDAEVEEIREKYSTGRYSQPQLGRAYGVCTRHVWCIVNYRSRGKK